MSLVHLAHVCSHLQNASLARLGLTSIPYTKLHLQIAVLLQKQGFFSTVDLAGATPPLSRYPPGTQADQTQLSGKGNSRESALARLVSRREAITKERERIGLAQNPLLVDSEIAIYADKLKLNGFDEMDIEWAKKHSHMSRQQLLEDGVEVEAMGLTIENQPLETVAQTIDPEDGIITRSNRATRRLWLGLKYWNGEPVLRKAKLISKPTKRIWLNREDLRKIVRGGQAGEVRGLTRVGEVMAVTTDRGIMDVRECVERQIGGQPLARFWG